MSIVQPDTIFYVPHGWLAWIVAGVATVLLTVHMWRKYQWNESIRSLDAKSTFLFSMRWHSVRCGLGIGVLVLLAMAASFRLMVSETVPTTTVQGHPVFFLVDVSRSMDIEDYGVSRLSAVERHIEMAVQRFKDQGHAYGLAIFTSSLYFLCPLTTDVDTFLTILRQVNSGILQSHGTRLTEALQRMVEMVHGVLAKKRMAEGTTSPVFVVFSDGEDFSSQSLDISARDISGGKFVFVGVGKDQPMPIPVSGRRGEKTFLLGSDGKPVMSRPVFKSLMALAQKTRGRFYTLEELPLEKVLSQLGTADARDATHRTMVVHRPAYGILGIVILGLLLIMLWVRPSFAIWGLVLMMVGSREGFAVWPWTYFRHQSAKNAYAKSNPEEARKQLEANTKDPSVAAVEHYNLGVMAGQQGDFPGAESHFSESKKSTPPDSSQLQQLESFRLFGEGLVARKQEKYDEAMAYFIDALNATLEVPASPEWVHPFQDRIRWHIAEALEKQKKASSSNDRQNAKQGQDNSPTSSGRDEQSGNKDPQRDQKQQAQKKEEKGGQGASAKAEPPRNDDPKMAEEIARAEALKQKLMQRRLRQESKATEGKRPLGVPLRQGRQDDGETTDTGPEY